MTRSLRAADHFNALTPSRACASVLCQRLYQPAHVERRPTKLDRAKYGMILASIVAALSRSRSVCSLVFRSACSALANRSRSSMSSTSSASSCAVASRRCTNFTTDKASPYGAAITELKAVSGGHRTPAGKILEQYYRSQSWQAQTLDKPGAGL